MKLSTKGHCAITAMLQMALPGNDAPISLVKLSKCQEVSLSYLEQILAQLRQQGLVKGTRGPGGGYTLAKSAHDISVGQVIEAVGDAHAGTWNVHHFHEFYAQTNDDAREMWNLLSSQLMEKLNHISLASLVEKRAQNDADWLQRSQKLALMERDAA